MSHRSRTASPMPSSKPFSAICPQIDHLQREQAERQAVRTSLTEWARLALSQVGHQPALHHALLLRELEALTRGSIDRLMVLMPPGSAKSTYASVLFPAWWFVQHPSSGVIATSHTADLAEHFGRQVRNLIVEHGPRLGYSLKSDNRSAGRWQISTRGEYFAAGVRGPITGRRADLAIIDDPIKSHAEADSPSYRDHVWNWYRTELMTWLKPGGRVVLIMTRWHEDDLGGRLLASEAAEWRALRLPALAEENDPLGRVPGAPLWPEWEDAAALRRKRSAVGERVLVCALPANSASAHRSVVQGQPSFPETPIPEARVTPLLELRVKEWLPATISRRAPAILGYQNPRCHRWTTSCDLSCGCEPFLARPRSL